MSQDKEVLQLELLLGEAFMNKDDAFSALLSGIWVLPVEGVTASPDPPWQTEPNLQIETSIPAKLARSLVAKSEKPYHGTQGQNKDRVKEYNRKWTLNLWFIQLCDILLHIPSQWILGGSSFKAWSNSGWDFVLDETNLECPPPWVAANETRLHGLSFGPWEIDLFLKIGFIDEQSGTRLWQTVFWLTMADELNGGKFQIVSFAPVLGMTDDLITRLTFLIKPPSWWWGNEESHQKY